MYITSTVVYTYSAAGLGLCFEILNCLVHRWYRLHFSCGIEYTNAHIFYILDSWAKQLDLCSTYNFATLSTDGI
jgi:hypothetical protein